MSVSERVVEDILSSDRSILAEILSIDPGHLSLIARQRSLASGKLDLLYLCQNKILLIELKTTGFYDDIVAQVNGYWSDLRELQRQHRLIDADIRRIILVTACKPEDARRCQQESIELILYRPEHVLSKYYENFRELSAFLKIRSGDYGVVRLGLLKSTLRLLSTGKNVQQICQIENRAQKTTKNRISVASLLGLVSKYKGEYFLTDLGTTFMEADTADTLDDRLSSAQIELLGDFVRDNPFHSSVTYTILTFVETIFVLAKSAYPVPIEVAQDYFVTSVGKNQTWRTERARETATYIFSNYACELLFLTKLGNHFYLAPKGIQAILLLQLNRSIKLIEAQR
jgi:hypothetical protein